MKELKTSLWYYPFLIFLCFGIYHQSRQFLLTSPDYSNPLIREMAAQDRAAAGLNPYATDPKKPLLTHNAGLEFSAQHIANLSQDIAKDGPCGGSASSEAPYDLAQFERDADFVKFTHDPDYVDTMRSESRALAKTLIAYGRGTFADLPPALQASMLKHSYPPPSSVIPDKCPDKKLDWVNVK